MPSQPSLNTATKFIRSSAGRYLYAAASLFVAILTLYVGWVVLKRTPEPLRLHESFIITSRGQGEFTLNKELTGEDGFVRVFICDETLRMDLQLERSFARLPETFILESQHSGQGPELGNYMIFLIEVETDEESFTLAEYWDGNRGRNDVRGPASGFLTCQDMERFDG